MFQTRDLLSSMTANRFKGFLLTAAASLLMSCGAETNLQRANEDIEQQQIKPTPGINLAASDSSAGRFNFVAPRGFVETSRSLSIYGVNVYTQPLSSGQSVEQLWRMRIAENVTKHRNAGANSASFRQTTIAMDRRNELGSTNTAPVMIYHPNSRNLTKFASETAFATQREFVNLRLSRASLGREDKVFRLFSLMIGDYRENTSRGFSLGVGSLTDEPSANERVHVALTNHDSDCKITFNTQTTGEPQNEGPLSNFPRSGTLAWDGAMVSVLERQERSLMRSRGDEGILWFREPSVGHSFVRYVWFLEGERGKALRPWIHIEMECDGPRTNAHDRKWDAFLTSLTKRQA